MSEKLVVNGVPEEKLKQEFTLKDTFRMPERFKVLNRLIMRDLNRRDYRPTFKKYTKEQILEFLEDPYTHEKQLRDACVTVYGVSSYFRRLIQYFTMLNDLAYVVSPFGIDISKESKTSVKRNFNKVLKVMEAFNVKSQFRKILTVCFREDVYYGTLWVTQDNITIQRLPSDYCRISSIEGNVYNVSFDFTYFVTYPDRLQFYPEEFRLKYEEYKRRSIDRWIDLDCPTSFAIKCTNDIDCYALPPFIGIMPEIYDLESYKELKLTKTELENYAILVMKLGLTSDGQWQMDFDKAREFWMNLDDVLPDAVGSVLTPMTVDKISFDNTSNTNSNAVADAISALFDSAGVSSLLFNNSSKSSSNALLLSIKADQGITYGVVKSIEDMVNRYIQSLNFGKKFRVTFLDSSPFNRDELGNQYLKMCQVGMPMVSYLAATYGMPQADMNCLNYLEDDILDIKNRFMPLRSTNTMSSDPLAEAGRPEASMQDISDNGEISQERDEE